ncbi:pyridoxamine 5'-phosphate oxidase family protein [Nocardioides limicola]|uniref:pyridoxamine 5'-phosphate oxidase family protein n=1 Tax=Nocardioides limicola TaxID=2803368 RepID=UPI00193B7971|nr:pyridoxamine 5'-phosphate oxidase family protein [Nocardioides sp. DJM-14]
MSKRAAVAMTDVEVTEFLQDQIKVQVATVGADGSPHLTTLFYVVDDGRIAFWTYGSSQKIRNLRRDPRISVLVEDGTEYSELRGVSITGRGRLVEDHQEKFRIGAAVAVRMTGVSSFAELGELGRDEVERQATKRVVVVVEPEKVATWDHGKLTGKGYS